MSHLLRIRLRIAAAAVAVIALATIVLAELPTPLKARTRYAYAVSGCSPSSVKWVTLSVVVPISQKVQPSLERWTENPDSS